MYFWVDKIFIVVSFNDVWSGGFNLFEFLVWFGSIVILGFSCLYVLESKVIGSERRLVFDVEIMLFVREEERLVCLFIVSKKL